MTNLDKDIIMMEKLGYGPHYGRYKADYPNTKEKEPEEILDESKFGTCRNCGCRFNKTGRHYKKIYCDETCRIQYHSRLQYYRAQERLKQNGKSL